MGYSGVRPDHIMRLAISRSAGGRVIGVVEHRILVRAPVAHFRTIPDRIGVLVFGADYEMAAPVGKARAVSGGCVPVVPVPVRRPAEIGLGLDALEALVEDHVDDPGDGVGAVDRGGTAGDR